MLRVVADTNVFISAVIFGGLPGTFFDIGLRRFFQLVTSPTLLDELDEKLRGKFELLPEDVQLIRARIESRSLVVEPSIVLQVIKEDPDDDRVLECAVAGEVDFVVSGDRHLLKLASYEGISILTVRQFLDAVNLNS